MLNFINFPGWLKPEIFPHFFIRWYGLMYIIAFAVAYYLFVFQYKENKGSPLVNQDKEDISNFFFWGILGLLIGARVLAATLYDTGGYYLRHPWLIFWPFEKGRFVGLQGMSYHGGVIGCTLGCLLYCITKKKDLRVWLDYVTAAIPLGYTFGRIGNFINGELYGRVTTAPWGIVFPGAEKFSTALPWVKQMAHQLGINLENLATINLPRHPSQLYEALFEGVVLWAILWFFRKRKPFPGFIMSLYLIGYGSIRFIIEYFREPDIGMDFPIMFGDKTAPNYLMTSLLNFTTGQILCFIMIFSGVLALLIFSKLNRKEINRKDKHSKQENVNLRKLRKRIK